MNIIVVGGGASGLYAAITAAKAGGKVTVLEKNEIYGKKLLATGNGRCNFTNRQQMPEKYHSKEEKFPWQVLSSWPEKVTEESFADMGVFAKDRNGWLYPYSDQAQALRDLLLMEARACKVKMKTMQNVLALKKDGNEFALVTEGYTYKANQVILACGSPASLSQADSWNGLELAENLGHRIVKPLPALTGLKGKGNFFGKWSGLRFRAGLQLEANGKKIAKNQVGEVQFTDYGISGIPAFQLSRHIARGIDEGQKLILHLDFMPDLTEEELETLLEKRISSAKEKGKNLEEAMIGLFPKKLIPVLLDKKRNVETDAEIHELTSHIKDFLLPLKGTMDLSHAQVMSGGVDCRDIDPKSMESRIVKGLYFSGEIVDVDGDCGGYNLQWAWSSGHLAGICAATAGGACND